MEPIKYTKVEEFIIKFDNELVIIDSDVAKLYGVETKRVNEAVNNNPDKFPIGYIIQLSDKDWISLKSKFSTLEKKGRGKHTKFIPKAFTEKGLYMLATILKSPQATQTTLAIIETYAKIRSLANNLRELSESADEKNKKALLKKSGSLMAEVLDDNLAINETETSIELNFAIIKVKHTIKRK
jgi:hypothetical protein